MQRTAIVTGASRGFGLAVAAELARSDWNLVIDARTTSDLDEASSSLSALGAGVIRPLGGDITDPDHIGAIVAAARELGPLSLLVNNAGILGPSPQPRLVDYPLDALDALFEVYLIAPLRLTQQALPDLRRYGGAVVNVTSDAAVEAYEGWGGYGAAKAALEQMSRVLAVEEPAVCVYWLDPGDMRTRMHQEAFPDEDIGDRPLPESRAPAVTLLVERRPPSGRFTAESLLETDVP
ncbi:MAG: SDR family oxidoreductase [Actinobacteria bacterium]|nr:SDR family oxidoreductase [Actinomycetota bacterium]